LTQTEPVKDPQPDAARANDVLRRFLDGPYPRAFAHRGWHTGELAGLENTAVAFERAIDEGFTYLETDVHASSDGRLVAFHDSVLDRVTDGCGRIADLPWGVLRATKVAGKEAIPLLEDLLGSFPDARFNIDAKSDAAVRPLRDVLALTNSHGRVCVASFSDRRVHALRRELGPRVATSVGRRAVLRMMARARRIPMPLKPRTAIAVQVPVASHGVPVATRRFIAVARALGLEVHVWTVDDPDQMGKLLDMGVDGLMTDRPDTLRAVLMSRGAWKP
jgi:glycerophosphoryl diester phosphodiesterase